MLDEPLVWANIEPTIRLTYCSLPHKEVFHLTHEELVEAGGHTIALPALSATTQLNESLKSQGRVEEVLFGGVDSSSYPYAAQSADIVGMVEEIGVVRAYAHDLQ